VLRREFGQKQRNIKTRQRGSGGGSPLAGASGSCEHGSGRAVGNAQVGSDNHWNRKSG
jgi:hypothetical protein